DEPMAEVVPAFLPREQVKEPNPAELAVVHHEIDERACGGLEVVVVVAVGEFLRTYADRQQDLVHLLRKALDRRVNKLLAVVEVLVNRAPIDARELSDLCDAQHFRTVPRQKFLRRDQYGSPRSRRIVARSTRAAAEIGLERLRALDLCFVPSAFAGLR